MKKLWIFYIDSNQNEYDKFKSNILNNHMNSKLKNVRKQDEYLYGFDFFDFEENKYIHGNLEFISIDNVEKSHIDKIVEFSKIQAQKLSTENMGKEKIENSISDLIYRSIENSYYWNLDESKPKMDSIFLCSKIFFEILNQHLLTNGNKRMATMILMNLLYFFGFYFKKTKGLYQDYSINKDIISQFVEDYQQNKNEEQSILKINNWIWKNVVVGLNFRN